MTNLITVDEVRSICLPLRNFDVAKFTPHINIAELQFIKPFLGKDFYNEIREEYLADSLSELNTTLVNDYLKNALAWYVLAKASAYLHIELRSGGFFVNNSEYSTGASATQRAEIYQAAVDNAEAYLDLAKEYLEDNLTDYPLYTESGNIDNQTVIRGGIVFDVTDETELDYYKKRNISND